MAGHSKFANIQHRKGAQDKKRASLFTKIAREIQAAVKLGGPDPNANPRLFRAMASGRAVNMPKDNIQRAIDRGAGAGAEQLDEIRYEGFGPGGVGIIVECLTDNKNRTAGEVRAAFTKHGGNLGETGSVAFMFDRVGAIEFAAAAASEDAMLEAALEAGAGDVVSDADGHYVYTASDELAAVAAALEAKFGEARSQKLAWRPQTSIPVSGDAASGLMKLMSALEDCDDVQNIYANYDIAADELERLAG